MFDVTPAPVLLLLDFLRGSRRLRLDRGLEDGLVGLSRRLVRPHETLLGARVGSLSTLLHCTFAVPPHIEDHARRPGHVDNENEDQGAVPHWDALLPVRHRGDHLKHLACDAGGVEDHEERVAQVEDRVGHCLHREVASVEEVPHDLGDRPRNHREEKTPVGLSVGIWVRKEEGLRKEWGEHGEAVGDGSAVGGVEVALGPPGTRRRSTWRPKALRGGSSPG
mmetsp:Transcript_61557/g.169184  ORF Transcript_61557/g.169184 Transcript_61557/m.169184 type:complete len:222 (-) Transcript_61557:296-961(-)